MKLLTNKQYSDLVRKANNWGRVVWPYAVCKEDFDHIPKRCPSCHKLVKDFSFKFILTGIGVVTLVINHCGHEIDITDYNY